MKSGLSPLHNSSSTKVRLLARGVSYDTAMGSSIQRLACAAESQLLKDDDIADNDIRARPGKREMQIKRDDDVLAYVLQEHPVRGETQIMRDDDDTRASAGRGEMQIKRDDAAIKWDSDGSFSYIDSVLYRGAKLPKVATFGKARSPSPSTS
eukprot:1036921-Amphidinium_carterae.1